MTDEEMRQRAQELKPERPQDYKPGREWGISRTTHWLLLAALRVMRHSAAAIWAMRDTRLRGWRHTSGIRCGSGSRAA